MEEIAEFLSTCPVFSGVPLDRIGQMAPLLRTATYTAGTLVLLKGGQSAAVYVVRTDVEVIVDAEVVFPTHDAMPKLVAQKQAVPQGLPAAVAHRLQTTMLQDTAPPEMPVVPIECSPIPLKTVPLRSADRLI